MGIHDIDELLREERYDMAHNMISMTAFKTEGVVGKALDTTCVPLAFQLAFKNSVLFGEFVLHCLWQVVGSSKTEMDSGTLMEREVAAVSRALISEFGFAATVFVSGPEVEENRPSGQF